ncbi:MAG TPA: hypothetical protein VJN18_09265 [Polyangiaceae bacterium]|nr:hypothetical protein [Polyangiaceae bacterium]
MKKNTRERPPARKLNREELDTGVLAAGCGTQGCLIPLQPGAVFINPAPLWSLPNWFNMIRFR